MPQSGAMQVPASYGYGGSVPQSGAMQIPAAYGYGFVPQQTPTLNLFSTARGQHITTAHKLERITTAAKEIFPGVVKSALSPLLVRDGKQGFTFTQQAVDAVIRVADRSIPNLVANSVPDLEVMQHPDDMANYTLRDIFEGQDSHLVKAPGDMMLLTKLLYGPLSEAIINCLPAAENSRYTRAMDSRELAGADNRLTFDLRSYLFLYHKPGGLRDIQGEEMAKEASMQAFQTTKFDTGRDLSSNLEHFERTLGRAQLLTENGVSAKTATYKLTEFVKGSGDDGLIQDYESVRFPDGMASTTTATYEKLLTQLLCSGL